jgi:hypothetical protein
LTIDPDEIRAIGLSLAINTLIVTAFCEEVDACGLRVSALIGTVRRVFPTAEQRAAMTGALLVIDC